MYEDPILGLDTSLDVSVDLVADFWKRGGWRTERAARRKDQGSAQPLRVSFMTTRSESIVATMVLLSPRWRRPPALSRPVTHRRGSRNEGRAASHARGGVRAARASRRCETTESERRHRVSNADLAVGEEARRRVRREQGADRREGQRVSGGGEVEERFLRRGRSVGIRSRGRERMYAAPVKKRV